jgi:RNA polymerase sigma-70 factor (ECF subfamily)
MTVVSLRSNLPYSQSQVDLATFELYYRHYLPKIFNYVSYRVPDQTTAEDLTASIFERALANFGSYSVERAAFSTWLFTIARNVVANYLRKQSRRPAMVTVDALSQVEVEASSPEQAIIEAEEFRRIKMVLSRLDEREQEVIALRFSTELKSQEIAQIMGLSPANVRVLLHRSLRKLRQVLQEANYVSTERP